MDKKIRIGINARDLNKLSGGTQTFILNILNNLNKIINKEEIEIFYIHNSKRYHNYFENLRSIYINSNSKILFDYLYIPLAIMKNKLDIFLFTKNIIPFFTKCKKILVIYDMGYFVKNLNAYGKLDQAYMKFMIPSSLKKADRVITISESTKKEILNYTKKAKNKIKVIYMACDNNFKSINNNKKLIKIKNKYNLPDKFILFKGNITPRKNLTRIISAFDKILNQKNKFFLVLTADKKGWMNKDVLKLIKKHKKIKRLGHVRLNDMPALYNLAYLYLYPSLYEGFGIPILEAQACGCPVITSNISSMPEVAGKGAILINPYNVNEIAGAIKKVVKDKNLRKNIIKEGYKNVKKFSWKKCAQEILNICKEVVQENN